MPIEQLSDIRRLDRDFKIHLGGRLIKGHDGAVRESKPREEGGYPKETEHFVIVPSEVPDDVVQAYGTEPHSLRVMLPFEWDATDPQTGDELVFNRYNRAYAGNKLLRCKGTGYSADIPGTATVEDLTWATRISQAAGEAMETAKGFGKPMYQVMCRGTDCPKYLRTVEQEYERDGGGHGVRQVKAEGVDSDATCKRVFILRAFLITPTTDPDNPDYCRVLGLAEIASSSFHTMVKLQSGFAAMRFVTGGQTAMIPIRLERRPGYVNYKNTRQVHHFVNVARDEREWQRMAAVAITERFMSPELQERRRQIAATPMAPTWDSVRDLLPAPMETPETGKADIGIGALREAGEIGPGKPEPLGIGPDGSRKLLKSEIDELKSLCTPQDIADPTEAHAAGLGHLKEIIALYNRKHETSYTRFSELTLDVYDFVKDYLG